MTSKVFFVFLFLCIPLATSSKIDIYDITDSNIGSILGDGKGSNWFLLFYLETCPYCKVAKESINTLAGRKELQGEDSIIEDLHIGKIECNNNQFACLRFNITRVPYIVMLYNDNMFEFNNYPSEDKLFDFLKEDKLSDSALPIPPSYGYLGIAMRIFEEAVKILNENIQDFIDKSLGWNIKWNSYFTIAILITSLISFLTVEYMIINFFFAKKKTKKTSPIAVEETNTKEKENTRSEENKNAEPSDDKKEKKE